MKPETHIQSHCKAPYLVATLRGYTKHYYAESECIASKIGGGIFSYEARRISKFVAYKKLGMCKRLNSDCSKRPKGASLSCLACRFQFLATICVAAKRLSFGSFLWQDKEKEQRILHDSLAPEKHLFFYHPDHLGSSSWITYTDGKSIQHLHYLPFGEAFVDQRISSFGSRYTFSAKEKDVETGYGFFGARYYSSDLSIWISVDPMADKYPHQSNYVYCSNNPIRLIDPNGEDEWQLNTENGTFTKVGTEGGDETDYYSIGTTNEKGEFVESSKQTIERDGKSTINSFRIKETDNSTLSAFHIPDAKEGEISSGFFLEREGPDTDKSGKSKRISAGSYSLTQNYSSHYSGNPRLFKESEGKYGTFAQRGILIHIGNYYSDGVGCLLPGSSTNKVDGNFAVWNSGNTVKKITTYCNNRGWDNIRLNIINVIK